MEEKDKGIKMCYIRVSTSHKEWEYDILCTCMKNLRFKIKYIKIT